MNLGRPIKKNQQGFTLIEIVVVIVVLGIMALMGSFGLKEAMDGYTLAQANSESTQKAQNALDRITTELSHIACLPNTNPCQYDITSGSDPSSISYRTEFGVGDHTINLNGSRVMIDGFPLVDRVVPGTLGEPAFRLKFWKWTTLTSLIEVGRTVCRLIEISLTLAGPPNITRTYNARVALQR